jgi:hypothetical protein
MDCDVRLPRLLSRLEPLLNARLSQALYPMEILPFEVRAKGLAFLNVCTQGASCINTFGYDAFFVEYLVDADQVRSLPVALSKLGWKGEYSDGWAGA